MDKELLERIALDQRKYWEGIRAETGLRAWSQAEVGEPNLGNLDPSTITPADWVNYWNRFVNHAESF
jgi:hypothetical protein